MGRQRIPQTQGKDANLSGAAQVGGKERWDSSDRYSLSSHHEACKLYWRGVIEPLRAMLFFSTPVVFFPKALKHSAVKLFPQ